VFILHSGGAKHVIGVVLVIEQPFDRSLVRNAATPNTSSTRVAESYAIDVSNRHRALGFLDSIEVENILNNLTRAADKLICLKWNKEQAAFTDVAYADDITLLDTSLAFIPRILSALNEISIKLGLEIFGTLSQRTELPLYQTCILPVLLYGDYCPSGETWTVLKVVSNHLQTFHMWRRFLSNGWHDFIRNVAVVEITSIPDWRHNRSAQNGEGGLPGGGPEAEHGSRGRGPPIPGQ
ncbi:unnamed protein product, partial [Soboliphyme baturini]|uniref:Reverse transcriptase domain-containing protein n=1 Tax=Soboliphyme baturini TaxID=241478 RepID=A0A183J5R4_9BILA